MNECQVWWTLTGNFGNIMPIDWSKTYTRNFSWPFGNQYFNSIAGVYHLFIK